MNLDDRIGRLKKKIDFDNANITEEGYGTFIPEPISTIEKAYSTKKKADTLLKSNRQDSNNMYLESLFLYIKGYREEEKSTQKVNTKAWQGLCKFIKGIVLQLNESEFELRSIFEYILYNIKMYYLHYEAVSCIKNEGCADSILKQYISLKSIIERNKIQNFELVKLDEIQEFVKNRLVFEINNK